VVDIAARSAIHPPPGGDVALSAQPAKAVPNALILGLRSAVLF
jgi:hypothetical protein